MSAAVLGVGVSLHSPQADSPATVAAFSGEDQYSEDRDQYDGRSDCQVCEECDQVRSEQMGRTWRMSLCRFHISSCRVHRNNTMRLEQQKSTKSCPLYATRAFKGRSIGRGYALLVGILGACVFGVTGTPALAATDGPGWELTARAFPTNFPLGGSGTIEIDVLNVGAKASTGPVTVTDVLPPGVTATEEVVEGEAPLGGAGELVSFGGEGGSAILRHSLWGCAGNGPGEVPGIAGATVVTCTNAESMPSLAGGGGDPNRSTFHGPNRDPQIAIAVHVNKETREGTKDGSEANRVTIAGGRAPTQASTADPVTVGSTPPSGFRFVGFDGWASNADGTLDRQAGSHPYELTVSFDLANMFDPKAGSYVPVGGQPKDIEVSVPPGLIGDPNAVPRCTRQQLDANQCPEASQVGILTASALGPGLFRGRLYNVVPPAGVPAEIGYLAAEGVGIEGRADFAVRSGSDYGLTAHADDTPERNIVGTVFTIWGVPGAPSHDLWRTEHLGGCSEEEIKEGLDTRSCRPVSAGERPFLTLPTACAGPQTFTIRATNWQSQSTEAKASFTTHDSNGHEVGDRVGFTGCERLGFGPSITTEPDTLNADTPAGLTVEVKPPIGGLTDPEGLAASDIQDTNVVLPGGLVINPGQAAGLQACQPSEDGLTTDAERAEGREDNGPPSCPLKSKVGTVEVETPLLKDRLLGDVFVLQSNPPNLKLLAAFSGDGVNIKLVLNVELNESTGQITTKVVNVPEFPATYFKLSFSGGPQAALDTPTGCTSYQTNADFTPWSSPFVADFVTTAGFDVEAGPGGQKSECGSPLPFTPSMIAGSTTNQAGGFTNFSLLLQRGDGQQRIEKLRFKEPAGLAGLISRVPLCDEANANAGTCAEASHIGHAVVTSGPGPYPLVLPQPDEPELPIYLTGPYKGAPFGLSIVTPVIAGPFNLGTIITRAKIEVDPHTAQITITTDPLPQIVDGVPTDLRSINSVIDRPGFLFNPTNCNGAEFTGTATSAGGAATAPLSSHFGVGSCQSLKFTPKVSVTTGAKSSKANGASLLFKISYPAGAVGTQSWFNEAKFDIPKQLPARLTTIQKACLASVFEANPAACPPASLIGHAIVHTPVLPVPLSGPVYFVSHGGAKFPDAVLVLQGDGVTVDLVGETFINGKTGVTSATFRNTPDVPFERIEVTVPSGPFSEFAANLPAKVNGRLCGQKLVMPTLLKAQNGLEIHQNIKVGVSGCAKAKALTRAQKLAIAMKACKKKPKHKRGVCVREARRKYGPLKKKKK